jgi:tRNA-splicing ligase RtcB
MIPLSAFKKISDFVWEIPTTFRREMRVPVRIFATRDLLQASLDDLSMEQAVNSATLPGLVGQVAVMPDMHQGYGFPIGGVAASRVSDGVVSPGAIGYDINCGVRLLVSGISEDSAKNFLEDLAVALDRFCPSGVGKEGKIRLTTAELTQVCKSGSKWALKHGMAHEQDLERTEEGGCLEGADPAAVSAKAISRGGDQLGTLGSGNHFLEVGVIDQVFDEKSARLMNLFSGNLTLMIHCGSRGFGHQICTDYVQQFQASVRQHQIQLPDRELVCAPIQSVEGQKYLAAMRSAANYAFCNRQVLAHQARQAFETIFAGKVKNWDLTQVYDVAHNMGKIESHTIDGQNEQVCVHRKGATRAFGPGSLAIPIEYRSIGQPVLVPGSMGTASWVLVGTAGSMQQSFGSCCHGAGRVLSRNQAKRSIRGDQLRDQLGQRGILIRAGSLPGLAEEAPQAYKDVDEVVEVVAGAGLARKIARIKPLIVIKG